MFVNLRGRSTYSMLEGIGSMQSIVKQAQKLWQSAIAITDRNGIYGAIDFYRTTQSLGVQPIIGAELPYISHRNLIGSKRGVAENLGTLTLLPRSTSWYINLLHLISEAYNIAVDGFPILDNQLLSLYGSDMFVVVGGLHSYAYQAIDQHNNTDQVQHHFDEILKIIDEENVVITLTAQSYKSYPSLKALDEVCLHYATGTSLKLMTSSIFYYPYKEQKEVYETALAIKDNKRTYRNDSRKIPGEHHILSQEEVVMYLKANNHEDVLIDQLIATTSEIAKSIDIKLSIWQVLFPDYRVPDAIEKMYSDYQDKLIQE